MAKGGKITKLMKKLSFNKSTKTNNTSQLTPSLRRSDVSFSASSSSSSSSSTSLHPVYVGKSRRQYFLSSDVVGHPLLRQLAEKSGCDDEVTVVGCEVVMFEHLLWMLDNADPMPESMDELVDFYAY